mgnify:CR=1 FL=1
MKDPNVQQAGDKLFDLVEELNGLTQYLFEQGVNFSIQEKSGNGIACSLKESTLRHVIVQHRDWHHTRFNALLNEEVRIANDTASRQALLYDPLIASINKDTSASPVNLWRRESANAVKRYFARLERDVN